MAMNAMSYLPPLLRCTSGRPPRFNWLEPRDYDVYVRGFPDGHEFRNVGSFSHGATDTVAEFHD